MEQGLYRSRYSYLFKTSKGKYLIYISKENAFLESDAELYNVLSEIQPGDRVETTQLSRFTQDVTATLEKVGFLCREHDDDDYMDRLRFISETSQHEKSSFGVVVVPTLDCNFACPYCFEHNKRASYMSEEVEARLCEFIVSNSNASPITLYWYGGEPLLALGSIRRILQGLQGKVKLKRHVLVSNGYLLRPEVYDVFDATFPLDDIQVTLDGNRDRHNRLRALRYCTSEATYDIIVSNIREFAKNHPSCEVNVRVNVDKRNYADCEQTATEFSLFELENIRVYPGMIRLENREQTQSIDPAFGRWEIAELTYQQLAGTMRETELFPKVIYAKNCTANRVNSYIVGPEGEIYKCWNDVSDPGKVVGNIGLNGITNPQLYYRYHSSCSCFNDPACRACFYLPICNGKCSWYQLKNKYNGGQFNLCQCLLKAPGMRDKILERYYDYISK